jgi:integrase/recombinase XerD
MIEDLFVFDSTCSRQREAPLLKEREQYLSYMLAQGVSKQRVRSIASMLLNVIRLLDLKSVRTVDLAEIEQGSRRWLTDNGSHKITKRGKWSALSFRLSARNWLHFLGLIRSPPAKTPGAADLIVRQFIQFLTVDRGMSRETIRNYGSLALRFLNFAFARRELLSIITVEDVDEFLKKRTLEGCVPHTIGSACTILRMFFRFLESYGLNDAKIARCICGPRVARPSAAPKGPSWKEVRRLLASNAGSKPADLRAAAICLLCAIYAMRRSEIVNLELTDFDWINEILTVRRAKKGKVQRFPLQFEVGQSVLRYLRQGRPPCSCRNLFVTLRPPFRSVPPSTIWPVIAVRMKRLGITSEHFGPHSLRHACATRLLDKGSSLKDIADFLGHRNMNAVTVYAKCDNRSLREVAAFSMSGLL